MAKTKKEKGEELDPLEAALQGISATFGEGSVISDGSLVETQRQGTGSLGLDIITGGGWGIGRMVELYGPESSGKTTICIHTMVQAQKDQPDRRVAMIDMEHAFDRYYAESLGLDVDKLIIAQPDNAEVALEIAERLISSGKISVCVIDSIASLTPKAEVEGEMGDNQMGLQARLMSKACRKLTSIVSRNNTVMLWTNQLREKIGVVYGSPEVTSGGNAMKFYASIRVKVKKATGDKDKEGNVLTSRVTVETVKNKLAPPFQKAHFDILFGEGIDRDSEIIEHALALKILTTAGTWIKYGESTLAQGAGNLRLLLKDNIELAEELEGLILKHYFSEEEDGETI
jgi:recombination protein RecA